MHMKSNLALEVPPHAVTPEGVVEKLQMNFDILRLEWQHRIENAEYDELLKLKKEYLVPRERSEKRSGKKKSSSWQGKFVSEASLLRMSELSTEEKAVLEEFSEEISIRKSISAVNDQLGEALFKKMTELRTTEAKGGEKTLVPSPENPESDSAREPEIAPATETHAEGLSSPDHVHDGGAFRADTEKKLRFLDAKIEAAILNRYNSEIGAKKLNKLKERVESELDELMKNPDSEISAEEAVLLDKKVRVLLEKVASEEKKRKNAKRETKEGAGVAASPLVKKIDISETSAPASLPEEVSREPRISENPDSDSGRNSEGEHREELQESPLPMAEREERTMRLREDPQSLEPNQEQGEVQREEQTGERVTEQAGQAEAEEAPQKKSSEDETGDETHKGLLDPILPIGKKTKGASDKKPSAPKNSVPKKSLKSAPVAPTPVVKEREEATSGEESPLVSQKDARETGEDLGAKMMDVSDIRNPYDLGKKELAALEKDMKATAEAAAQETPYIIGSRRHAQGKKVSFAQDTDRALGQETVGGEAVQKLSSVDLPQKATKKTLAEMPVTPLTDEGGESEAPGSLEHKGMSAGENAETEDMPAVMHRRGDPSWRPLHSEEGKKEELRQALEQKKAELKQALRGVLAEIGESAEILAQYEDDVLEAKKHWEEAAATREYQENNFGGRLIGLFTSEASKKKTLENLRKEEEDDRKHYENMEARAGQLRRSFDLLKGRRDEIERDLEEIAIKESRPHNLESQAGSALGQKEGSKKSEENETIAAGVREKFATMRLSAEYLQSIEGFADLSEGQQLLVFENLQQLTVGRIQEEAERKTDQERQESGLWGRLWKSVSKRYQIAKAEKQTAAMMMRGGKSVHGEVLTQLVRGMREKGPEVELGKDGKTLEIQFASGLDASLPEPQVAKQFNSVANAFARIPYEWSLGTAAPHERKQYESAKAKYDISRKRLFDALQERSSGKVDSLFSMNDIDRQVQMMQFVQNNPELEKQLEHFKDEDAWKSILLSVATERGLYAGAGYLGKTLLVGGLGWAVAPVVSSVMGGFLAEKRAQEELRKREKEARKGIKDESREAKNFNSAESLSQKLELLIKRVEEGDESAQEKAAHSLKTRIEYTRTKIEKGLVDFGGSHKERLWHQYDLLQRVSRAEAVVAFYASEKNTGLEKRDEKVKERLERLLGALEEDISAKEKSYVRKQVLKGAAIAAGFALCGAALRAASELAAERLAISPGEVEPKDLMYEISPILYTTDEGASLPPSSSVTAEISSDWDKVSPQDVLEVPPPEPAEGGLPEEAPTEVSRSWDEAASEATLSTTDPRPEVAFGQGLSANAIGVEDSSLDKEAEGLADEQGLERLVEKLSDEPEQELAADNSSLVSAESIVAEKADISQESISQPATKPTLSPLPAEELSPLSAFPEDAEQLGESVPAEEASENRVADLEKETVAPELGDTKAFVREHPEMLEPLKKEIGSYRLAIFQTPETKGAPEYDYARSNLGKVEMGKALESYEYGEPSELHESQLRNLSEFREATQKAFMAKLGEREGKGMSMVAAGETVNEYTRRMATIALQLKVKIKGF